MKVLPKTGIIPGWFIDGHDRTPPILSVAFARSASQDAQKLTDHLHELNEQIGKGQGLDLICILEPPTIVGRVRVDGKSFHLDPIEGTEFAYTSVVDGSDAPDVGGVLMLFCLALFNFLNRRITVPPDLFTYADQSGSVRVKWLAG